LCHIPSIPCSAHPARVPFHLPSFDVATGDVRLTRGAIEITFSSILTLLSLTIRRQHTHLDRKQNVKQKADARFQNEP
jgi:hypothetical protein